MPSQEDVLTARTPFIGVPLNRGTNKDKDARFVNCYFDVEKNAVTQKDTINLVKRPGLGSHTQPSGGANAGRGIYSWLGSLYSVFNNKVYKGTSDLGITIAGTSGLVGISELRPGAASPRLCINDGASLWTVTSAGATAQVAGIPDNTTDLIYMDGYLFTLGNDGSIWNCSLDDPATWAVTSFITPIMLPGAKVGLGKIGDFLVYFSDSHHQLYFDNANTAGGPLENYPQGMHEIGCASQNSIAFDEHYLVWVGASDKGEYGVFMMEQPGQPTKISTSAQDAILDGENTSISTANGKIIRTEGHVFYILKLTAADRTLVYDLELGIWMEWQVANGTTAFPIVDYALHSNRIYGIHATDGRTYTLRPDTYQDNSVNFTVLARFGRNDFGTNVWKSVYSLEFLGDKQSSATACSYQYSDDDYITTSTAIAFDMSDPRPMIRGTGRFRRRAHQISYTGSGPLRMEGLEIKYRLGEI